MLTRQNIQKLITEACVKFDCSEEELFEMACLNYDGDTEITGAWLVMYNHWRERYNPPSWFVDSIVDLMLLKPVEPVIVPLVARKR